MVITLGIFTLGIEHTGLEWYLLYTIPALGFAVTTFGLFGPTRWVPLGLFIGLTAAFPMLLIDPDEVSLVINSGNGELVSWVTRAGGTSLALVLVLGLLVYLFRYRLFREKSAGSTRWAVIIPWVAAILVFTLIGKPGFYGERLFVVLKDQADVSSAAQISDYDQRRTVVYQTLVQQAIKTQASLRQSLDRFGIAYTPYYLVNGMEVQGGPLLRAWLEAQPAVDRVLDNPILRPLPENPPPARGAAAAPTTTLWNQSLIQADRVWNDLHIDGKGIVVGQSDSGVQGDHPDLASSYRGSGSGNDFNWLDPWNHSQNPGEICGHGTHSRAA